MKVGLIFIMCTMKIASDRALLLQEWQVLKTRTGERRLIQLKTALDGKKVTVLSGL